MGVFIQLIQQAAALLGAKAVMVKQDGHGLQGRFLAAAENIVQIKLKVTLFVPFVAVDKGDGALAE